MIEDETSISWTRGVFNVDHATDRLSLWRD
jgi:hypothetical protein